MDKENLIINGRYLVLENIGKGGAGEVFLARDIKNGRKYALKGIFRLIQMIEIN